MKEVSRADLVIVLEHALVKCPQCKEPNATSISLASRLGRCHCCGQVLIVPSLQMLQLYRSASQNQSNRSRQQKLRERLVAR